jgi:DNA-binding transcriptional LysR family regulator
MQPLAHAHRRPRVNLARLDLVSLRLALLCAEKGSLSAAAAAAHLSVSGASHKLSTLERSLGITLFTRLRRGLAPTQAGEEFTRRCRRLFEAVDELLACC